MFARLPLAFARHQPLPLPDTRPSESDLSAASMARAAIYEQVPMAVFAGSGAPAFSKA